MIEVRSTCAEPGALEGRYVLVAKPAMVASGLHRDALYCIRLDDGRCVLKRVTFPEAASARAILQAINTTPGFRPIEVSVADEGTDESLPRVEEACQVLGALFASSETFTE